MIDISGILLNPRATFKMQAGKNYDVSTREDTTRLARVRILPVVDNKYPTNWEGGS